MSLTAGRIVSAAAALLAGWPCLDKSRVGREERLSSDSGKLSPERTTTSESDQLSIRSPPAARQTILFDRHGENQEFSISEKGGNGARIAAMHLRRGAVL